MEVARIPKFSINQGICEYIRLAHAFVPNPENPKVGTLKPTAFTQADLVQPSTNEFFVVVLHDKKFSYVLLIRNVDKHTVNLRRLSTYSGVKDLTQKINEMVREGEEPHVTSVEVFEEEMLPWINFFGLVFKPWRLIPALFKKAPRLI